ncbi:hypothetical protein AVEN_26272-1 [Araneus ventricosus]|uniref:Uncharacterized protein n=1 Tax=Araneus ventricosus TaxID=182803 RepID=A0A4Y2ANJ8_ARAVE|nr:hypothetical protein AVEN_26272-1 [Araneus ventricosus]
MVETPVSDAGNLNGKLFKMLCFLCFCPQRLTSILIVLTVYSVCAVLYVSTSSINYIVVLIPWSISDSFISEHTLGHDCLKPLLQISTLNQRDYVLENEMLNPNSPKCLLADDKISKPYIEYLTETSG